MMILLFWLLLAGVAQAACGGGSPTWTAAGVTRTDVRDCLTVASPGDTISVPAGTDTTTWTTTLTITKNVSLIGAGVGLTVIRNSGTDAIQIDEEEVNQLLIYSPTTATGPFRISGFSFDLNNRKGFLLLNNSLNPPITQLRIDHNRFYNSNLWGSAMFGHGVRGVIDSNTFEDLAYPLRLGYGNNIKPVAVWDWANFPELAWGTNNNNIYVEDNVFINVATAVENGDEGGRYAFRYNTFGGTGVSHYPWFDMHGGGARGQNFPPGIKGTMGAEVYGNTFSEGGYMMSHRGGRLALHHNQGPPSYNPYNNSGCPAEGKEKINNSYVFQNRVSATGAFIAQTNSGGDDCGGVVVENTTFWLSKTSFTGAVGVGAGTLTARPATCTTGVGYWATNQSTTNLTGMVGANPSTPISGTLYKCTSTNTWTAYYTPLAYPHPLRALASTDNPPGAPAPPQNIRLN